MTLFRYLTDFADQAVILPLFAMTATTVALAGWWRGALVWVCVIGTTLLAVLACKLLFFSCGAALTEGALRSPSGHTAAAAAVYGGLVAIAAYRAGGRLLWTAAAALVVATVIGASRLALDQHTWPDVVAGGLLGTVAAVGIAVLAGRPPPRFRFGGLALLALLAVLALHGARLPAETLIQDVAARLAPALGCAA